MQLRPLEIGSGLVVGRGPALVAPTEVPAPVEALERAVRPALTRGLCLVSFSGGHDSSLVLAGAARVARTEGLPLPVPITWRFTDAPRAEESAVQEEVVSALQLPEWIRLQAGDDLDMLGPVARDVLLRHGLRHPANAFLHAPLYARASGGTVLTGIGGDQLFARWRRPRRPWRLAPRTGVPGGFGWLRPAATRAAWTRLHRERRRMPRAEAARARWKLESRDLALGIATAAEIAAGAGAHVGVPLADARLLASVERTGLTAHSAGGRAPLLAALFGEHYPATCLAPRRKAIFNEVFWRRHTRDHLDAWDGGGLDEDIVDPQSLAAEWRRDAPSNLTALLVQQTWLAQHAPTPTGDPP